MYFSRVRIRPEIFKSSQLAAVLAENVHGVHRLLWDLFPGKDQRDFLYREEIAREQLGALPSVQSEPIYYLLSKSEPVASKDSLFRVESKNYRPDLKTGQRLSFECRINPIVTREGKKHDVMMDTQLRFLKSLIKEFDLESMLGANPRKGEYKRLLTEKGGESLDRRLLDFLQADQHYSERLVYVAGISERLEWAIKACIDRELEKWLKKQGERLGFTLVADRNGLAKLQYSGYRWHGLPEKGRKVDKAGFSSVDFCGELQITELNAFKKAMFGGIGRSKAFGCGLLLIRRVRQY